MKSVICPVCGAKVMLSFNAKEGDIVTCPKCGARLRSSSTVRVSGLQLCNIPMDERG